MSADGLHLDATGQSDMAKRFNVPANLRPVTLTIEVTAEIEGRIRKLTDTGTWGATTEETAAWLLAQAVRRETEPKV